MARVAAIRRPSRDQVRVFSQKTFVYILFVLLGLSSWIAVNGIFTELPILFATAPEGYGIASDMALALQIANVVPFVYFLLNLIINPSRRVKWHMDSVVIVAILVLGVASLAVLAIVWDRTFSISAGAPARSWPLLGMVFLLGVVDCTSTLTYWPFVGNFGPLFFVALSVGESATSLLSGIIGLIQQPGSKPLFSFAVFCVLLIVITLVSMVSFVLLRFLPLAKREMQPFVRVQRARAGGAGGLEAGVATDATAAVEVAASVDSQLPQEGDIPYRRPQEEEGEHVQTVVAEESQPVPEEPLATAEPSKTEGRLPIGQRLSRALRSKQAAIIMRLFVVMGTISFFENGLLVTVHPRSIENYPQGSDALLRYQIIVGQILSPLVVFFAHFKLRGKPLQATLAVLHALWIALATIAIVWACLNPAPPAKDSLAMGIFMVIFNITCKIAISFVKVLEWKSAQESLQAVKAKRADAAKTTPTAAAAPVEAATGQSPTTSDRSPSEGDSVASLQQVSAPSEVETPTAKPVQAAAVDPKAALRAERQGRWDPFRFGGLSIQIGSLLGSILAKILADNGVFK